MRSRYTTAHALAATAALGVLPFLQGFAKFWEQFVYGLPGRITPKTLMTNLTMSALMYSSIFGVLWLSSLFCREDRGCCIAPENEASDNSAPVMNRWNAVKFAACAAPALTIIALALNWICACGIEWLTGVKAADQEMVKCFSDASYPLYSRIMMIVTILIQAPLLEEPIFRGIIFRGFAKTMSTSCAIALSGFVFALVHVNASSFLPLWFLGAAFAFLYQRTQTIMAPMCAHFIFNATNILLITSIPQEI